MSMSSAASAAAMPSPMPLVEPVTMATRRGSGTHLLPGALGEGAGMAHDDAFLVGGNAPRLDAACRRTDQARILRVRFFVEGHAEPCGVAAHARADLGGMLA